MKKTIGIVSEGPTDYMVLKAVIDKISGEENEYRRIQPESDMKGRYGNGWKGVWRWCKETSSLDLLMHEIQPQIDAIVVQMDGDVIRKEKEVHCRCDSTICEDKGSVFPLYCGRTASDCPINIPCKSHNDNIEARIEHGKNVLKEALNTDCDNVIITIPCDSTDAWIVAAYGDDDYPEKLIDPWKNIIAKGKYYHGVRVRGDKKNTNTYSEFINVLYENIDAVIEKCDTANLFKKEICRLFK